MSRRPVVTRQLFLEWTRLSALHFLHDSIREGDKLSGSVGLLESVCATSSIQPVSSVVRAHTVERVDACTLRDLSEGDLLNGIARDAHHGG